MARSLSQTLIQKCSCFSAKKLPTLSSSRFLNHRKQSNQAEKGSLIEVDLEQENEVEVLGLRRLEDAIHGIIVRRSAPDWLPFIPGSSYWVPPRKRTYGLAELVGKLANPLTEEETLSLSTVRGWPSTAYFVEGASSPHPVPPPRIIEKETITVEKEATSKKTTTTTSQPEDEEG